MIRCSGYADNKRTLLSSFRLILSLALMPLMVGASLLPAKGPVRFEEQIAPILAEHCLRCHSPLSAEGDISLATVDDLRENAFLSPGDPESSYLLELLTPQDGLPPAMPQESPPLSDEQLGLLTQWIAEGATWPSSVVVREKSKADSSWWSLQPLQHAEQWVTNASQPQAQAAPSVDGFIRSRLKERNLSLSPPADRRTLIRRLSFDLHGLPPSPEAVSAFLNDADPLAYEKLVDRMLASPRYGERFARHWLDIAHYADTHGFERDKRRDSAWRYRDYVIEAFNDDKPYDRFLLEQIAGDVLWSDDEQAVIATGFLAAGPWDFVGHVETKSEVLRRSARSLDLDDMLTQVMTATVGMTINCARCHDHKLDPITQEEYYQLQSVFAGVERAERNTGEAAQRAFETRRDELTEELKELTTRIRKLEGDALDLADMVGGGNGFGTGVYRHGIDPRSGVQQTLDAGALGGITANRFAPAKSPWIAGVFIPGGGDVAIGNSGRTVTISGLPSTSKAAWDAIRNGPVASQHSPILSGVDFSKEGHSLLGLHANAGITFNLEAIRSSTNYSRVRFSSSLGYFGADGDFQADAWVYIDGHLVAQFRNLRRADGLQAIDIDIAADARYLTLVSTDGGNGFAHDQIGFGDPKIHPLDPPSIDASSQSKLAQYHQRRQQVAEQLQALRPPPEFFGVVAKPETPDVRVLLRGNPESPIGNPLPPAALSSLAMLNPVLGTVESNEGDRRAALARWITHPNNPLTPRVIVNRIWHWHFGQGIVNTPSDFGYGGDRPSHPDLLDWLAAELQSRDWSLKEIHRLILTSDTYKQASHFAANDDAVTIDADNRLLWRQNARRMEAEAIRDAVLQVSGQLNLRAGGPGFEDFRYEEAYAPIYTYITADEPSLLRRSIYRYVVRTTPNAFMTTLDCPDPANLTPQRSTTTTPLQSLALVNNEFILKQSQYFAERVKAEAAPPPLQIKRAFALAYCREPSDEEARLALAFLREHGLFALCRSLLNSNEFVYVD